MIDDDDWLIGEDIVKKPTSSARCAAGGSTQCDHANGWQPARMDEFVDLSEDEDYGGVHINSGIPNRTAFLMPMPLAGTARHEFTTTYSPTT